MNCVHVCICVCCKCVQCVCMCACCVCGCTVGVGEWVCGCVVGCVHLCICVHPRLRIWARNLCLHECRTNRSVGWTNETQNQEGGRQATSWKANHSATFPSLPFTFFFFFSRFGTFPSGSSPSGGGFWSFFSAVAALLCPGHPAAWLQKQ